MTLYEFRLLPEQEQAAELWNCGEYFLSRTEINCRVLLYKMHSFYVEVYYENTLNQVIGFNPFSSKGRLGLYFQLQKN